MFTSCLEISSSVLDSSQSCCRREALNQSEGKVIYIFLFVFIYIYKHFWIDIHWVLPPPCEGFTFWFNRGFLLPTLWDCYRLRAVPKIYTSNDYGHGHIFIFTFRPNIRRSSKISSQVRCFTEFQPSNHYPFGN